MTRRPVRLGLAALIACLGCTSWTRLPDSRPVPARGMVQVWSGGQPSILRDPHPVGDSLVGRGPSPDTTRRTLLLTKIDSVRTQTPDLGKTLIVGSGLTIVLLLAYLQGLRGLE
jgi:hypothetical protein